MHHRSKALAKAVSGTAAVAALLVFAPLAAQAGANLSNESSAAGTIGPVGGAGQADEFGEVLTAPVSGTLSAFTLTTVGAMPTFTFGIGTWNGSASFALGGGVTAIDYQSGPQT